MEFLGQAVVFVMYCAIGGGILVLASSCLFRHEGTSGSTAAIRVGKYLASGPVTLLLSMLLCSIYLILGISGTGVQARLSFGLPNDNVWAFIIHPFLHADIWHILGNVIMLLICGGLVEQRAGRRWFIMLVLLSAMAGGYLSVRAAPMLNVYRLPDDPLAVGFSIVNNAVFVFCTYLVFVCLRDEWRREQNSVAAGALLFLKRIHLQMNPLKWSQETNKVFTLAVFLIIFAIGVDDGSPISILGHSIGAIIGFLAAATHASLWLVLHRGDSALGGS